MTTSIARGLGALALAAALGAWGCTRAEETAEPRAGARPVPVAVETVTRETLAATVEAVGTVRSRRQSVLSSKIVATVRAVLAREGDRVRAGQPLLTLDDRDVRAQLERAQAARAEALGARDEVVDAIAAADRAVEAAAAQEELARATRARYRTLLERELIAPQDYDEVAARLKVAAAELARARELRASLVARRRQAEAAISRAEAEVENARIVLGWTTIAAPTDGVVAARSAEVGNLAAPGVPLLTVEEEVYRLEVAVPESDVARLAPGQTAAVVIDALGATAVVPIVEIVPAADPMSRTFVVKVDLGPRPGLKSGLYGRARFTVGRREALTVPRAAVVERGQLEAVFVEARGVASLRLVRTGPRLDGRVEILSGLDAGERVVTAGAERLVDGVPVEVRR